MTIKRIDYALSLIIIIALCVGCSNDDDSVTDAADLGSRDSQTLDSRLPGDASARTMAWTSMAAGGATAAFLGQLVLRSVFHPPQKNTRVRAKGCLGTCTENAYGSVSV